MDHKERLWSCAFPRVFVGTSASYTKTTSLDRSVVGAGHMQVTTLSGTAAMVPTMMTMDARETGDHSLQQSKLFRAHTRLSRPTGQSRA